MSWFLGIVFLVFGGLGSLYFSNYGGADIPQSFRENALIFSGIIWAVLARVAAKEVFDRSHLPYSLRPVKPIQRRLNIAAVVWMSLFSTAILLKFPILIAAENEILMLLVYFLFAPKIFGYTENTAAYARMVEESTSRIPLAFILGLTLTLPLLVKASTTLGDAYMCITAMIYAFLYLLVKVRFPHLLKKEDHFSLWQRVIVELIGAFFFGFSLAMIWLDVKYLIPGAMYFLVLRIFFFILPSWHALQEAR